MGFVFNQVAIKRMSRVRFRQNLDFSQTLEERVAEKKRLKEEERNRRRLDDLPIEAETTDWANYPSVSNLFDRFVINSKSALKSAYKNKSAMYLKAWNFSKSSRILH